MQENNKEEKLELLNIENQDKNNLLLLLHKIFHVSPKNQNSFSPILISTEDIPKVLYNLKKTTELKNEDIGEKLNSGNFSFQNKIDTLKILFSLFRANKNLMHVFMNKNKSNNTNTFFGLLIDLYLNEEITDINQAFLEEMLIYIITNITIPKFLLEYIYQKLAIYLRYNPNDIKLEKLNQNIFLRYLNLLEIFYTNSLDKNICKIYSSKDEADEIGDYLYSEPKKEIKNYIYFNGINCKMTLFLNDSSNNVNCDFPTLDLGCSFSFWINLDKDIINEYYIINHDKNNNKIISLISFLLGVHQIRLQLINIDNLLLLIDNIESNPINIKTAFNYGNWNNICVIVYPKKPLLIKISINGNFIDYKIHIPKNYNLNTSEKIDNITFFENLIGRITSVLFCSNVLNNDLIKYFGDIQGFYKIKHLYKFLSSVDNNYSEYFHDYKYYEKFKNIKENKNFSKINIYTKEQNIKNIIGLFCPFSYQKRKNQIEDVFGNFIAIINSPDDGVNNYINYSKNIIQIGEINNLLPMMELLILSQNKNKLCSSVGMNADNLEIEILLSEEILLKYMHIIRKIITGKKHNLSNANQFNFFSHLGLFLEKMPSKIFTSHILNIFYEIGKETFQFSDNKNKYKSTFVNMILLNDKIFSKFSEKNQLKLWDDINKFFTSDYSQLKDSLNMAKICMLLRFYDKERYNKYCCKKHADLFRSSDDGEENNNIMEPDMNTKVGKLFETIQLFVNNLSNESDTANLFKLLSLDLSPCLQKKIIKTYQYFFENNKIQDDIKNKAIEILLKNDFFDIFEYALNISLLDIRTELIELLRIISSKYKIESYIKENKLIIFDYIGEYLLPDNLKVITNNCNNILNLVDFFNKDIYNEDISALWNALNNWITYKSISSIGTGKNKQIISKLNANQSIINIFIEFVSKVSPYYIDCFLILLFSLVSNITINNRTTFLDNNNFYKWIIEVIYFFNNKQNEQLIKENKKSNIEQIKIHAFELFKNYIIAKKGNETNCLLLDYLLDYSFYLKRKNKDNKEQIKEITNITRKILFEIIDSSSWDIDIMTKACFEFMFLHKNSEFSIVKEENNKERIDNNKINDQNNTDKNKFNNKYESKLVEDEYEIINEDELKDDNLKKMRTLSLKEKEVINKDKSLEGFTIIGDGFDQSLNNVKTQNKISNISLLINEDLIPDYLYENLYMKEQKDNINESNQILKEIWEDSKMYEYIIDYYSSNIWGIENMCKIVKIEYDKEIKDIFKELLKEYGENKQYKNTLIKILNKYLSCLNKNIKDDKKEETNLLNLNLILLCIAYDTTGDNGEKNYIENKLEQFLIFCILGSVNISTLEKMNNLIQLKLYDLIGYGLFFLNKRDEFKYNQFVKKIIQPIFEDNEDPKNFIKGIFTNTKKVTYKNTAIYKLFIPKDSDIKTNKDGSVDLTFKKTMRAMTIKEKLKLIKDKNSIFASLSGKNMVRINKQKDKQLNFEFVGDMSTIIRHIIKDTIKAFLNERNSKRGNNNIKEFNKYIKNDKKNENKLIKEENRKINEKILSIAPLLEEQIRKYSFTSLIQEKRRINEYKKVKKTLFSWRGFWSQRELFYEHPEFLKLSLKNHYSKEMTKIILTPILDLDYYFPPFSKFDKQKLFNKNDFKYKVNLNINSILLSASNDNNSLNEENKLSNNIDKPISSLEEEKKENKNNESNIQYIYKNKFGFNYLECIYKLSYEGLWEQYKLNQEQKIILDNTNNIKNQNIYTNLIPELKFTFKDYNIINENIIKNKNVKIINSKIFKCCIVKSTHHINGYIMCEKSRIKFKYSEEGQNKKLSLDEIKEDLTYDKDMNNCFGSTFKKYLKDKDKVYLIIKYEDIQFAFLRKYFYQNTALEIFTKNNKSFYFNFKKNVDLCDFMNQIISHFQNYRKIKIEEQKGKRLLGHEQLFIEKSNKKKIKAYYASNKLEEWQNYKISTLEYLMWLNIYSGRSFNDLTQYPVFPWIISNYKGEKFEEENDLRNLSMPIGMIEYNEKSKMRKEAFIDQYDTIKNDLKESNPDFNYQDYLKKGEEYFYNYRNKKLKNSQRNYSVQIEIKNDFDILSNSLGIPDINDNVSLVEIHQLPSYFGSHYSNPTYVSHYLARVFPFSFISIEIQGEKFDNPNRLFYSMEKTFESCMTLKDDVRELIPEFYFMPEIFKNKNNLNLTQDLLDSNGEKIIINDVELPPWAHNSIYNFIIEMRNNLEKNQNKINKWIDLIFGTYQKGEKAEEIHNIFQPQTYERMVKIDKIKDIDERDSMMRLVEVGVTPFQIFDKDSRGKIDRKELLKQNIYSYAKGIFLDESNKLNKFYISSSNYNLICSRLYENTNFTHNKDFKQIIYPSIIAIKCLNPKNLKIFTNNNYWFNIKITNHENKIHLEESDIFEIENNSSKYAPCYSIKLNNIPFIIYNKEKYAIRGGFWDSHLEISSLTTDNEKKEEKISKTIFTSFLGPIIIMKMTKDEKLLFCGTKNGNIIIFDVDGPRLDIKKLLYSHTDEIISIFINENLNMFASSSIDGYINIYILPSFSLVRSIKISTILNDRQNNGELYADNIFLSSNPLPCLTIYIEKMHIFKSYTINGDFISQIEEEVDTGSIISPIVFQNLNFKEFLVYGTEDGYVKIRSFPNMNLIYSIKPFEKNEIKTLELSPDKRFCFVSGNRDKIAVIEDSNTSTGFEMKKDIREELEEITL